MNATGNYRRQIRAGDLVAFKDDESASRKPFDAEKRKQQFIESARLHKKKFWRLINGRSLDDIKIPDFVNAPDMKQADGGKAAMANDNNRPGWVNAVMAAADKDKG